MMPAVIDTPRVTREFTTELLTGEFKIAVESLDPELASKSQSQLEETRKPTEVDFLLRKKLWMLAETAQKGAISVIEPVDIYGGICSRQTFFNKVIPSPQRVAWLMTHPQHDITRMEAGLSIGLTNLIEFVSKAPTADTAGAFIKAIEILLNRVHGPVIQKIQAQHAHLNMNKPIVSHNPQNSEQRLEELKSKLITVKS